MDDPVDDMPGDENGDGREEVRGREEYDEEEFDGTIVDWLKGHRELKNRLWDAFGFHAERREECEESLSWLHWLQDKMTAMHTVSDFELDADGQLMLDEEEWENVVATLVRLTRLSAEEAMELRVNPLAFVFLTGDDEETRDSYTLYRMLFGDEPEFDFNVALAGDGAAVALPVELILFDKNYSMWEELFPDRQEREEGAG